MEDNQKNIKTLNLSITQRCNLSCKHCGALGFTKNNIELSKREYFKLLDEAKEIGCEEIIISGGEPLIRNDLMDILNYIDHLGMSISILTNGTLVNQKFVDSIKGLSNLNYVRLSLEYCDEGKMDEFRGKAGVYKSIFETINLLKKQNINVGVNMTIVEDNISDIGSVLNLLKENNVDFFRAVPVVSIGSMDKYIASREFYVDVLKEIFMCAKTLRQSYGVSLLNKSLKDCGKELTSSCPSCDKVLSITADGYASLCPLMETVTTTKNIKEYPLKELVEECSFIKKNLLKGILSSDFCECTNCEDLESCKSGCIIEHKVRQGWERSYESVCPKQIFEKAVSSLDNNDKELRRLINNNIIKHKFIRNRLKSNYICFRALPIWTYSLKENLDINV